MVAPELLGFLPWATLCGACWIVVLLMRHLRRDIRRYNYLDEMDDALYDKGWKEIHGDVFRLPKRVPHLFRLVGSGLHLGVFMGIYVLYAFFFVTWKMYVVIGIYIVTSYLSGAMINYLSLSYVSSYVVAIGIRTRFGLS